MNKSILIIIAIVLILTGGYFVYSYTASLPKNDQNQVSSTATPIATTGNEQAISIDSGKYFFKPESIKVKLGVPVVLTITSQGEHTFTIDELGVNAPTNGVTTVRFTPNKKGTFQFYCAVPGHRASGQWGVITVE